MRQPFPPRVAPWAVTMLLSVALFSPLRADDEPAVPTPPAARTVEPALAEPRSTPRSADAQPPLAFAIGEGRLTINCGEAPVATYVFADPLILRPYFSNLFTPTGERITRHHPPREGVELTDHETMHPGIGLGFGDLSGADFWRNKATVRHVEFTAEPRVDEGVLSFTVKNRYVSGEKSICEELATHTLRPASFGWLLTYDSTFTGEQAFAFGDQEEMGLGVRVAPPLCVRGNGGRIVNAEGLENEAGVWGKVSEYVVNEALVDGRRHGLLLVPHPQNFRKSWFHARDYGFVAANPFGRKALGAGEPSRVTVQPGETFRLRFGILAYSTPADEPLDAKLGAKRYVDLAKQPVTEPVIATDPTAN